MTNKTTKLNIKHYWDDINGAQYNKRNNITLDRSELILLHALLSDAFEKITSGKYRNTLHRYSTDLWEINTIISIEQEIWGVLEDANNARVIIQTFLDQKREWFNKHHKEILEERDA